MDNADRQRFEQALRIEPAKSGGDDSAASVAHLLLERFGTPRNGLEQDRQSMQDYLRQLIPLSKRREAVLYDVLGALGKTGSRGYLNDLIGAELKHLVPRNALMIDIKTSSPTLDLEQ
ncbi:YopR/YscH family type III secretion effector [Pseudomonas entomophila]|uniref:YopR/YscH family type III secretion effector n=1 Tax=Pseudomonas entomophila TaxID=312306 RepID=UPI0024068BEA|nr:YopR/YscH family type III secretion effector [Pseudomonas entomophila]MDF9618773.1 YopR/YscH family type III secretion effector [Pseudomonas entomophila]